MASTNKQGKMAGYLNWRMKATFMDGRTMQGQMLAFDKHMNLVLADTEEFRTLRQRKSAKVEPKATDDVAEVVEELNEVVETEEKRTLGLTIIRGSQIVSLQPLSPPPQDASARLGKTTSSGIGSLPSGPGISKPAGRGLAAVPPSLAGPAPGVGGAPPPAFGFPGSGPPPGFPGAGMPPGFPGRGAPPFAGYPGPSGYTAPPGLTPSAAPPGAPPGFQPPPGFPPAPGFQPGFQPPPRR